MKKITWICLNWLLIFSVNAQPVDEALPSEVKPLIGMKMPVKAGDVVPGWKIMGAGLLVLGAKGEVWPKLGYELLYQKNISIFVIDAIDEGHNRTILDARVLPEQFLSYTVKDGKIVYKKNSEQFYEFVHMCESKTDEPLVVGLVRPEQGVSMGRSDQVIRAWVIDTNTGHISKISPKGVTCFFEQGD